MAGFKRFPNGTVQFTIKRAGVLEKPIYLTYPADQEEEARAYIGKVEELLLRGIVPGELREPSRVRPRGKVVVMPNSTIQRTLTGR